MVGEGHPPTPSKMGDAVSVETEGGVYRAV